MAETVDIMGVWCTPGVCFVATKEMYTLWWSGVCSGCKGEVDIMVVWCMVWLQRGSLYYGGLVDVVVAKAKLRLWWSGVCSGHKGEADIMVVWCM